MHNMVKNKIVILYPYSEALCIQANLTWLNPHKKDSANGVSEAFPKTKLGLAKDWQDRGVVTIFSVIFVTKTYTFVSGQNTTEDNFRSNHPYLKLIYFDWVKETEGWMFRDLDEKVGIFASVQDF